MYDQLLTEVRKKAGAANHKLLFFDYDGTLSPIVNDPQKAYLDIEIQTALQKIAAKADVSVVIVTGRSYQAISDFVNIQELLYITNHGNLTIKNDQIVDRTAHFNETPNIQTKYQQLLAAIQSIDPDIYIEEKEISTAFHYRNVSSLEHDLLQEQITTCIQKYFVNNMVQIKQGKKVVEIFPAAANQNKGTAISRTYKELKSKHPNEKILSFFIGDDLTDEDGFIVLNELSQITIKVGSGKTAARWRLDNTLEVKKFVLELTEIL